jgi:hypothetical protein
MAIIRWQLVPQGDVFVLQREEPAGGWRTIAGGWKTEQEGRNAADAIIKVERARRHARMGLDYTVRNPHQ